MDIPTEQGYKQTVKKYFCTLFYYLNILWLNYFIVWPFQISVRSILHKRQRHKPLGINCIFNSLKKKSVFCCFHKQIQQLLFSIGIISRLNHLQLHNSFNNIISPYPSRSPAARNLNPVHPAELILLRHIGEGCHYT